MKTTTLALATLALDLATRLTRAKDPEPDPDPNPKPNTYGLPKGRPIEKALREWFRRQRRKILGTIPKIGLPIPASFPSLTDYDDPMQRAMTPLVSAYWQESGERVMERLGLDPAAWQVTNPHTAEMIRTAALNFSESTNRTTSLDLADALARLRSELHAGIVEEGESIAELTGRVNSVFDRAEGWRARQIAASEASRAVHAAQEQAALESGVVAGLEWLVSAASCPLCRMVAAEANKVRLGQAFAEVGDNPAYRSVRYPPLHPTCRCSVVEVLKPEYGGPEHPDWAATLKDPRPGDAYEPPRGVPAPAPTPGRLKAPAPKLKSPSARHYLDRLTANHRRAERNSLVLPGVDIAPDIAAIQGGAVKPVAGDWTVNGRVYSRHGKSLHPVSGPGIVELNKRAYSALQKFIANGENIDKALGELLMTDIPEADIDKALELYELRLKSR